MCESNNSQSNINNFPFLSNPKLEKHKSPWMRSLWWISLRNDLIWLIELRLASSFIGLKVSIYFCSRVIFVPSSNIVISGFKYFLKGSNFWIRLAILSSSSFFNWEVSQVLDSQIPSFFLSTSWKNGWLFFLIIKLSLVESRVYNYLH